MDFNRLKDLVHQNAIDHGWWEELRSMKTHRNLIHSEVTEAFEEYRNHHGLNEIYYTGESRDYAFDHGRNEFVTRMTMRSVSAFPTLTVTKPEGIPTELADIVIRILDLCGHEHLDIDADGIVFDDQDLNDGLDTIHTMISRSQCVQDLIPILYYIQDMCDVLKIDLEKAISIKHEYNKTRPYKHGGKKV